MTRLSLGFTQRLEVAWLERAAQLALTGMAPDAIREQLQIMLRPLISVGGDDNYSNRGKLVGMLMRVWVRPHDNLQAFRDDGLSLLARTPPAEHLPIHWGMLVATYPFFTTIAEAAGRLTTLQGDVMLNQVLRRTYAQFGERTSVRRACQRVFYSIID